MSSQSITRSSEISRPRTGDKRAAILEAAVEQVALEGVAATTGAIAKRAGVAHGSVFHYFENKAELLNAMFLMLKHEIHERTLDGLPEKAPPLRQLEHLWKRWIDWGVLAPVRHRALERLTHEDVIRSESRLMSQAHMARGIEIVRAVSAKGVFKDEPIDFVARFFEALASTTMETMISDPARADLYRDISFQALIRAIR